MRSSTFLKLAILAFAILGGYKLYRHHQDYVDKLSEDEKQLEALKDELELNRRHNESEVHFERRAIKELGDKLKVLGEERTALEEKLHAARNAMDAPELSYLEHDIRRQQDVVGDIQSHMDQVKSDRVATHLEAAEILTDSKEQTGTRSGYDESIQNEQAQVEALKSQQADYRRQRDWANAKQVQAQIQEHLAAIATLKENRDLSVEEIKNRKDAQRSAAARENEVKAVQSEAQKELDIETRKLTRLKGKLKAERDGGSAQIKSLRGEIAAKRSQIEKLVQERKSHQEKLNSLLGTSGN